MTANTTKEPIALESLGQAAERLRTVARPRRSRIVPIVLQEELTVGAILAMTVDRYFAGLSAIVGAGLMFAVVAETCGTDMVLARMPWSQIGKEAGNASCSKA
jgi:hypothetical protein